MTAIPYKEEEQLLRLKFRPKSHSRCSMFHGAWQDRLKLIMGSVGYQAYMRRSLQTVVLYEAKRCIAPRIPRLRPFQKRALLLNMIYNILREIDFLSASEKEAVLWKTQRSQEQLDPVTAWKRCKIIERDLSKLLSDFPPFVAPGRPHSSSVDMLVQDMYNTLNRIEPEHAREARLVPPPQWEYLHNHAILTLRVYYHGTALDLSFPDPIISPFEMEVPSERPPTDEVPEYQTFEDTATNNPAAGPLAIDPNALLLAAAAATGTPAASLANPALLAQLPALPQGIDAQAVVAAASLVPAALMQPIAAVAAAAAARVPSPSVGDSSVSNSNHSSSLAAGDRLQSLLQAREQMELHNRLHGVLPDEELARRKRELYDVLGLDPKQQEGKEEEEHDKDAAEEPPRKKAAR